MNEQCSRKGQFLCHNLLLTIFLFNLYTRVAQYRIGIEIKGGNLTSVASLLCVMRDATVSL